MNEIYTERFFLSAGEVNAEREMSLPLLFSKFIDLATAHANILHLGNPDMVQYQAGWVLSRIAMQMLSYPAANEWYSVSTWVERWTRRFSVRCFMVSDAQGNAVGYARSVWMILSTVTHESLPLSIFEFDDAMIVGDKCPAIDSQKHREIAPYGAADIAADVLPSTAKPAYHTFKYCDLDFYRHVNTVRYVALILNQFSLESMDRTTVSHMEMSFMHEGMYGESIEVRRHDESELTTSLSLVGEDDRNILYARVVRIPRS